MRTWKEIITEATAAEVRKAGEAALKDEMKKGKKEKEKKQKSSYQDYLERQLAFKREKYEAQKKAQIERLKQGNTQKHVERAKASLSNIKTEPIGERDKEGTAYSKLIGNVGSAAAGVAGAAYHGVRALAAKRAAAEKAEAAKERQQEKRERQAAGKPVTGKKLSVPTSPYSSSSKQKAITGTPDRPLLSPEKEQIPRLPPSGSTGMRPKPFPSMGQRARKNPALKSSLISQRMKEGYSNWRNELLIEVDDKESGGKKKEKVINVMKGKNKVIVNPDEKGFREEVMQPDEKPKSPNTSSIAQVLTAKQKVDVAQKDLATKQKMAAQRQVDLQSLSASYKIKGDVIDEESPAWQRKEGKNPEGGLNKKGIAAYRREHPGSKLSLAVTTPPSKLNPDSKAAKRRKSFCARMGGSKGPMKDEKGRPTRKALSLRKWNC